MKFARRSVLAVALMLGASVAQSSDLPHSVKELNNIPIQTWAHKFTVQSCFANLQAVVPNVVGRWANGTLEDRYGRVTKTVMFMMSVPQGSTNFIYEAESLAFMQFEDLPKGGRARIVNGVAAMEAVYNSCDSWYDLAKKKGVAVSHSQTKYSAQSASNWVPDDVQSAEDASERHVQKGLEPW